MSNNVEVISSLIELMNRHPSILTLLIILIAIFLITILIGLFFGIKHLIKFIKSTKIKTKFGEIEFNSDKNQPKTSSNTELTKNHYDEQFMICLSQIVKVSVDSGFERSVKRQELYNRQLEYANLRYENIISELKSKYIDEYGSSNIKIIDLLLHYIFNECAIRQLIKIFKADRLLEKSKEELIEANRHIIESTSSQVVLKAHELSTSKLNDDNITMSVVNEFLINMLRDKSNEIRKTTTDIIETAYNFALDDMNSMYDIHSDLSEKINNVLLSYFGKIENLPKNWNDDLPPNEIIGESL